MTFDEFEKELFPDAPENAGPQAPETPAAPESVTPDVPEPPVIPQADLPEPPTIPQAPVIPEPPAMSQTPPSAPAQPAASWTSAGTYTPGWTPEERPVWSEPAYEPARAVDEDTYTPGRYAYGVQGFAPAPEPPKKKKSHVGLKIACAVLLVVACAAAAALASFGAVRFMIKHNLGGINNKQVVMGSSLSAATENVRDEEPASGEVLTGNQVYRLACEQVVGVNTSFTTNVFGMSSSSAVSGSGFIISEDGYIVTNYHVISYAVVYDGELTVLTHDGAKHPAQIVGYLESNDIAVIKIDASGLNPVALGNSDNILVGEDVYAVGNPLGELEYSITDGIVSAQDRMITTKDDITGDTTSINMFQITAAVNAGNSGGPVYNARGEVIGVVTAKYADEGVEGLGFAIPINDAVSIARQLIEKGFVAGAGLGIRGTDVTQVWSEFAIRNYDIPYGVHVDTVNAGSAAEAAGIKVRDIITAVGGREVTSMTELKLALRRYSPGDKETITVYRMDDSLYSGKSLELTITFEELVEETTTQQPEQQRPSIGGLPWPFN